MKRVSKHENVTLEDLEGRWPAADRPTRLMGECHRLRRVQLGDLSVENLRILIGQNIGLRYLMPFALEKLRNDPLAEGEYHPGDLLCSVLSVDSEYWIDNAEVREELTNLAQRVLQDLKPEERTVRRAIQQAMDVASGVRWREV
jgi:hypothetical protein